jgi:hypothetical protein
MPEYLLRFSHLLVSHPPLALYTINWCESSWCHATTIPVFAIYMTRSKPKTYRRTCHVAATNVLMRTRRGRILFRPVVVRFPGIVKKSALHEGRTACPSESKAAHCA